MYKVQQDKYQKARGGTSRVLDVSCEGCNHHVAFYQKDGPGILKRMYVDRFIDNQPNGADLICDACERILGNKINYKKEDRAAYRLYVGSVKKKIVSRRSIVQKIFSDFIYDAEPNGTIKTRSESAEWFVKGYLYHFTVE